MEAWKDYFLFLRRILGKYLEESRLPLRPLPRGSGAGNSSEKKKKKAQFFCTGGYAGGRTRTVIPRWMTSVHPAKRPFSFFMAVPKGNRRLKKRGDTRHENIQKGPMERKFVEWKILTRETQCERKKKRLLVGGKENRSTLLAIDNVKGETGPNG